MARQDVSIARSFADLPDPRVDRTRKHRLDDILVITLCAVISGADSWEEVERFGRAKEVWLRGFLTLPNGIPSHDAFYRLFARVDPRKFGECVAAWLSIVRQAAGLRHIAIDGKAVRAASGNTFSGCLHLVNAWAAENRVILGQEAVADGSHEIAAIPPLLKVLALEGALATIDAAGCQKEIARQIRDQGGHYLLAVKGNQPRLYESVQAVFKRAIESDFHHVSHDGWEQVEKGHGRHEERYVTVIHNPEGLPPEWPEVAAVVLVGRERTVKGKNASTAHYLACAPKVGPLEVGVLR